MTQDITHESIHKDIRKAIQSEITAQGIGLHLSPSPITLNAVPNNALHRAFVVDFSTTSNTFKYRDRRDQFERLAVRAIVREAIRINKRNQEESLDIRDDDHEVIKQAVSTSIRWPLNHCRTLYNDTVRLTLPSGEWLIQEIAFNIEFDWSMN